MKKIGLISDTHGYLDEKILEHLSICDEIWHAGDVGTVAVIDRLSLLKPLRAVYGNIDGKDVRAVCKKNERFVCEGVEVWITHIGGYPGRYSPDVRDEIKKHPPQLFICGHSHILKVIPDKKMGLLHINPGAVGTHGFHKVRTMVRFVVNEGKISDLEVIELYPRRISSYKITEGP